MAKALEVHVTAPDRDQAAAMARILVEEGLAACVNIVDGVRSIYVWDGTVRDEAEVLCLMKTRPDLFPALRDRVLALHPYEVAEILAFEVADGSPAYLEWVARATGGRK
jgi:periplasmic divalent cation tolerance protein